MLEGLYGKLVERARGQCEACGCSLSRWGQEADHFFSRARAEESESTVWLLCPRCHFSKTRNHPDASSWLRRFIEHCRKHGYVESVLRAEARLQFVDTRRSLGAALGVRH